MFPWSNLSKCFWVVYACSLRLLRIRRWVMSGNCVFFQLSKKMHNGKYETCIVNRCKCNICMGTYALVLCVVCDDLEICLDTGASPNPLTTPLFSFCAKRSNNLTDSWMQFLCGFNYNLTCTGF